MNSSKIALFVAAALISFPIASPVSARTTDQTAAPSVSPAPRGDRLALNPQPLPPLVEPDDEDRW
ncbi:MAG: hypothetical protein WB816_13075 [Methylocystis sp.]